MGGGGERGRGARWRGAEGPGGREAGRGRRRGQSGARLQRGDDVLRLVVEHAGRLAREADERGGLAVRLREVVVELEELVRQRLHLHQLALHHLLDDRRQQLHHPHVAQPRQQHRRAREEEVSREDGDLVAVDAVGGARAAARVGEVDHVVVQQAGRVDHLGNLREARLTRVGLHATRRGSRREEHDGGTEALARQLEEVLRDARQHRMVAAHQLLQRAVQRPQLVGDEAEGVGHRRRCRLSHDDPHGRALVLVVLDGQRRAADERPRTAQRRGQPAARAGE